MCTIAAVADLGKRWVSGNNGRNVEIPRISMCSGDGWQPQRHHRLHYGYRSLHILRGASSSTISISKWFRPNVCKWFATSEDASQGSGNINPGWGSSWQQTLGGWSSDEGGVLWDAHAIAEAVNGKVVADGDGTMGSICTDTRSLRHGQWFLALTGRNFDGHAFIYQADVKNCTGVIANHVPDGWSRGFVQVEGGDTLKALQGLASNVRARFRGPVVGITGSVGKTTVRAMTALALTGLGGHVHETQGNLNNHVGVPLTLLRLNSQSVACVLEMGMNHRGEILELAEIARPNVRVVLNVGPAHMENFRGGLEEVAMAKGEMFKTARPGDICVVNADDPLAMAISIPAGVRVVQFGAKEGSDVRLVAAQATRGGLGVNVVLEHTSHSKPLDEPSGVTHTSGYNNEFEKVECISPTHTITRTRAEFEIPKAGLHLASNACAAAAIATSLGISLHSVAHSLSLYKPVEMRCQIEEAGPPGDVQTLVINDCYNANPMSVKVSLQLLHSMHTNRRRIAVLGDMLELGGFSLSSHKEILQLCVSEFQLDLVIVVGTCFSEAAENFKGRDSIIAFRNTSSLANHIARFINLGDAVLVKGSRGMQMEVLVDAIKTHAESW